MYLSHLELIAVGTGVCVGADDVAGGVGGLDAAGLVGGVAEVVGTVHHHHGRGRRARGRQGEG